MIPSLRLAIPGPTIPGFAVPHLAVAALVSTLLLSACGGQDASPAGDGWTTTRDTLPGGIPRVVNTPPASGAEPGWTLVEEFRIGSLDEEGPATFGEIRGLVVTDEGLVAVLDAQAQEVRVFDAGGAHLVTHGGRGEGPGELTGANGLLLSPDGELRVPDARLRRMSAFDPVEGFLESEPIPFVMYGFIYQGAMMDDGRVVKPSIALGPPRKYLYRIFGPDMTQADTILLPDPPATDEEDPPTSFRFTVGQTGSGYMGVPFAEAGARLIHPSGQVWTSGRLAGSHRMARTTLEGDTTLIVETGRTPVPIDPAVRDSAIAAIQDRLREMNADIGDQSWDKVPQRYPFVERMAADEAGNVWVETGSPDGTVWDVFTPEGEHLRTVATDLPIQPWLAPVIRGDTLWAVVTDELDVPYVMRARVVPLGDAGS